MLFQTCGACRATNYMSVLRQALRFAGFGQVPVFAAYGMPEETDAFRLDRHILLDVVKASVYGDLLMSVKNRLLPYEKRPGSVERKYKHWLARCKEEIKHGGYFAYRQLIKELVLDFEQMPVKEVWKPKVGIVGEILVKYHRVANNDIEKILLNEGAEVVMPNFVDFFLYNAYDAIAAHRLLAGSYKNKLLAEIFIKFLEFCRRPVRQALAKSERFRAPLSIKQIARLAERHVSLGNMAGEGWFLTGEMVKLIEEGVPNVVCLQPFGCLPNHITGKGVLHELRARYPAANIVAIDCDAGSSEVNQLNRLKLMLAVAKEQQNFDKKSIAT